MLASLTVSASSVSIRTVAEPAHWHPKDPYGVPYLTSQPNTPETKMTDTLSPNLCRTLFSEKQWDLIYAMVGHALDDDEFDPHDVYSIRNKIHSFFEKND